MVITSQQYGCVHLTKVAICGKQHNDFLQIKIPQSSRRIEFLENTIDSLTSVINTKINTGPL